MPRVVPGPGNAEVRNKNETWVGSGLRLGLRFGLGLRLGLRLGVGI